MRNETEAPAETGRGTKYSVVTYIAIFFVLVVALVLLSYFVQGRRSSSSYATLRLEYQQDLEQHRDRLNALEAQLAAQAGELEALRETLSEREAALEALTERAERAEKDAGALEKELEALQRELKTLRETVSALQITDEE